MQENNDSSGRERESEEEVIDLQAVGVPERKRLGEAVEAAFLAKATMLGFPVLKPWGDSRPYDFGVDGGQRIWKVQVKCATSHRNTRCSARAAGSGELYTLEDIDFLAAYVIEKTCGMWCRRRRLCRGRRYILIMVRGARECLKSIERRGACSRFRRGHGAVAQFRRSAGAGK